MIIKDINRAEVPMIYQDGCNEAGTPATLTSYDGIDTPTENLLIAPLLPSAVAGDSDAVNWRIGAPTAALAEESRLAFGICLKAPFEEGQTLYEYTMVAHQTFSNNVKWLPFFGQLNAEGATPEEHLGSGTTTKNESCWMPLPANIIHTGQGADLVAKGTVVSGADLSSIDASAAPLGNPVVLGVIMFNISDSSPAAVIRERVFISISGFRHPKPLSDFLPKPIKDRRP